MDIRQLEYFIAVVDNGGVTRAAEVLHITQPTLSQAIRGVERELKADLFHRTGRKLVLSSAGEALVGPARVAIRSMARAKEAVAGVRELTTGRLDICALPDLAAEPVGAWVGYFRRKHRSVTVRMDEADDVDGVLELLRSGQGEVGFVTLPAPLGGLRSQLLAEQVMVLVCPPATGPSPAEPIPIAEVANIPLIVDGRHTTGWSMVERQLYEHGVDINVAVDVKHPNSTLNLVMAGAGATFMPFRLALRAQRAGARIVPVDPPIVRRLAVVHRQEAVSAAATAFIELVRSDADRWVTAIEAQMAGGLSYVAAAMAVDEHIWQARLTAEPIPDVEAP